MKSFLLLICVSALGITSVAHVATSAENQARFLQIAHSNLAVKKQIKWGEPQVGKPAVIRYFALENDYTFVPDSDAASFASRINCSRMQSIYKTLERTGIHRESADELIRQSAAVWSKEASVSFVKAESLETAQVVIGTYLEKAGTAWSNLQYADANEGSVHTAIQGAICLSQHKLWQTFQSLDPAQPSLVKVLSHEWGHVIGLDHCDSGKCGMMDFPYPGGFDLSPAEKTAIASLYGPRN